MYYSKIGIHLLRSKLKNTGSDAQRPVLLKMALNALKNLDLASSKQHLLIYNVYTFAVYHDRLWSIQFEQNVPTVSAGGPVLTVFVLFAIQLFGPDRIALLGGHWRVVVCRSLSTITNYLQHPRAPVGSNWFRPCPLLLGHSLSVISTALIVGGSIGTAQVDWLDAALLKLEVQQTVNVVGGLHTVAFPPRRRRFPNAKASRQLFLFRL